MANTGAAEPGVSFFSYMGVEKLTPTCGLLRLGPTYMLILPFGITKSMKHRFERFKPLPASLLRFQTTSENPSGLTPQVPILREHVKHFDK